ncbi:alpha-glucuronidase family glycosyl hydrolase [Robiginitalea sp. M366]|uniref:alpha-glucuronidase family glycosyl hydrolase n=1 Tax=Robiginitalea aestuariiviva TaxID=3036903 RepID=UPI00240D44C5|nr:alpha-glucuronidase family glycosyl hydrolase [Robiginitalea aestuariiviva]MDG1571035.1 alpha-glucuronidase family glycosyl hydrolase [Robiginitalea aestuariiviva]
MVGFFRRIRLTASFCPISGLLVLIFTLIPFTSVTAQAGPGDGYDLWLDYQPVSDTALLLDYQQQLLRIQAPEGDGTPRVIREELQQGLSTMLGREPVFETRDASRAGLVVMPYEALPESLRKNIPAPEAGIETYRIHRVQKGKHRPLVVTAHGDSGLLYGTFHLLRLLQMHQPLARLDLSEAPRTDIRMLNHWDNLDRTIERGYSGFSIWNWQTLPDYIDPRYMDYARANASVGINGTALTSVNANALILTPHYLEKVKALADLFRPYGLKVYLTARFSAPMEIGGLSTADPLDPGVIAWWRQKADEIYAMVPDFGGFLVKANSEGQPGPQNYGRTHLDGANMLADAVAPHGGVIMWRAFVYSEHDPTDRAKQAYSEFVPYDGKFRDNVLLQVKNGPIDFQPREPFHPMFGAMEHTPLMMEFQITKEYLGFATHLVYLPKLFEETLQSDTYRKGKGSTVSKVVDGSLFGNRLTGMAGVSNIGTDYNWTGHLFGQADWYGFGRLAWDPDLSSETIAGEWLRCTFSNDPGVIAPLKAMMLESREAVVNYMNPLGLHHIFDTGHHYGPGPWVDNLSRPEWNPVYYHQADAEGIGFDRTATGSDALSQYAPEVARYFGNLETCPEEYLLWFHHLPWDYPLKNGRTLWDNLGMKYQQGVDQVREMILTWESLESQIPPERYRQVHMLLGIQLKEAQWWRDACMLYFQTFSGREFPPEMEPPQHTLEYYKSLKFPYAPGIRPRWN